ncbi:hypothetical protein GCM10009634_35170 [Saccharothrix xinjiangensis]
MTWGSEETTVVSSTAAARTIVDVVDPDAGADDLPPGEQPAVEVDHLPGRDLRGGRLAGARHVRHELDGRGDEPGTVALDHRDLPVGGPVRVEPDRAEQPLGHVQGGQGVPRRTPVTGPVGVPEPGARLAERVQQRGGGVVGGGGLPGGGVAVGQLEPVRPPQRATGERVDGHGRDPAQLTRPQPRPVLRQRAQQRVVRGVRGQRVGDEHRGRDAGGAQGGDGAHADLHVRREHDRAGIGAQGGDGLAHRLLRPGHDEAVPDGPVPGERVGEVVADAAPVPAAVADDRGAAGPGHVGQVGGEELALVPVGEDGAEVPRVVRGEPVGVIAGSPAAA